MADAVVLGLALSLLYYLKINFFVGAVGFVVWAVILGQVTVRVAGIALGVLALAMLLISALLGNNLAYVADVYGAVQATPADLTSDTRLAQLRVSLGLGLGFAAVISATMWLWLPRRNLLHWINDWWRPLGLAAGAIGIGAFIATQNHNELEITLHIAAVIIAFEFILRRGSAASTAVKVGRFLGGASMIGLAAIVPLVDTASVLAHTVDSRSASVCPLPGSKGTPAEALLVPRQVVHGGRAGLARDGSLLRFFRSRPGTTSAGPCDTSTREFLEQDQSDPLALQAMYLVAGLDLLRTNAGTRPPTVLALAFTNPYPFLFRTPPPAGALLWWDKRTFSAQWHPDPAPLVGSVDHILDFKVETEPRSRISGPNDSLMARVYRPYFERSFQQIGENRFWRLWRRQPIRSDAGSARSVSSAVEPPLVN
jgi:hypothetical protein